MARNAPGKHFRKGISLIELFEVGLLEFKT